MILYRVQISNLNVEDSWSNEWHPTQAKGFAAFNKLVGDLGDTNDIHLDEVDVPTIKTSNFSGRDNLANALNGACMNRDEWRGKELKRHCHAQRVSCLEDLLS